MNAELHLESDVFLRFLLLYKYQDTIEARILEIKKKKNYTESFVEEL